MLALDIPGFGPIHLRHLVSDFTGTLSVDGTLLPGVAERMQRLTRDLDIHVVTADTFGTVRTQVSSFQCSLHVLVNDNLDKQKEVFVSELGAEAVVAIGNGNNDRLMLAAAKVGVAVLEEEGCASDALRSADVVVRGAVSALDLLLSPLRLKATLRF